MTAARKASTAGPAGIVLIAGSDEFQVRRELAKHTAEYVSDEARGFDFSEFRSSEVEHSTLWNALITMPLLAARRVVLLHLQGEPDDDLARVLTRYAADPTPTTLLIIVQLFDNRGTPIKLDGVNPILCSGIKNAADRAEWAQQYVKQAGKELPPDAAEYIVGISSSRLAEIAAKLEHAVMYSGEKQVVTCKDLMAVSGVTSEYLPWHLEDAILERQAPEIFKRARALEAGGEEILRLLAFQRNALLTLWKVGALAKKAGIRKLDKSSTDLLLRESRGILGNKTFKSPVLCKFYLDLGEGRIRQAMVDLLDLEVRIKTGRAGWREYYDWIWKLIAPVSRAELQTLGRS